MSRPSRVAIIGGGCASMAAAWELSRTEHQGRFQITVYQEGWRLGGKGASGRGPAGRIEEHGLHIWFGFYDNAFRMMRECYADLQAAGVEAFGDWRDAWYPESDVGLMSPTLQGGWERWSAHFAPRPGLPGDPVTPAELLDLKTYLVRAVDLVTTILLDTRVERREPDGSVLTSDFHLQLQSLEGIATFAGFSAAASLAEGLASLASTIVNAPAAADAGFLQAVERMASGLRAKIEARWLADAANHHVWELADLTVATVLGLVRDGVLWDRRGLDALEDYEGRAWLLAHGASERALQAPYIRGLYDLSMGYEDGDLSRPNLSAGQGLRGILRTFFGYRGSMMWRMRSGMGDIVFAPLYEALRRRGVEFRFFHRLTNVGLAPVGADGPAVSSLAFDVQARTRDGGDYRPLIPVQGRPCWPSEPDWAQLAPDGWAEARPDFESFWDRTSAGGLELRVGEDFDQVILGVGLGAVPYVCQEFLARDLRWRQMCDKVKTIASQAFQVWLREDLETLGWSGPPYINGAFAKPFDTWCDMAQVVPDEGWPDDARPATVVYFCAALPDPPEPPARDDVDYPRRRAAEVRAAAVDFLRWPMPVCWPRCVDGEGDFRWSLLVPPDGASREGPAVFDTQYWRANVNPSERYVIHVPGSTRFRISPLDRTYDNFTLVGDGTDTRFYSGCVEAAVMSGRLAAHSFSGSPGLEEIVGYDHP